MFQQTAIRRGRTNEKGDRDMSQTDEYERDHIKAVLLKHLDRLVDLAEREERHGLSTHTDEMIKTAEALLTNVF